MATDMAPAKALATEFFLKLLKKRLFSPRHPPAAPQGPDPPRGKPPQPDRAPVSCAPGDYPARILLATDAASESIDLKYHCAHLKHRLVQMCLHLLRAELWSTETRRKLHRVTARTVPNEALDTPAVIAHGRILVLGGDNHRLHEEIAREEGNIRRRYADPVPRLFPVAVTFSVPERYAAT